MSGHQPASLHQHPGGGTAAGSFGNGSFGGAAGGGLAAGVGLLASAALIAGGLATAGSLTPAPVTSPQQVFREQLAKMELPFIAAPILPGQVPGTVPGAAPGRNAASNAPRVSTPGEGEPGGMVNVPEPASIGLLAAGAIAALLARRNARHA